MMVNLNVPTVGVFSVYFNVTVMMIAVTTQMKLIVSENNPSM